MFLGSLALDSWREDGNPFIVLSLKPVTIISHACKYFILQLVQFVSCFKGDGSVFVPDILKLR